MPQHFTTNRRLGPGLWPIMVRSAPGLQSGVIADV